MPTLSFKGKTFIQNHHLTVKYHQLIPNKKHSLSQKASLHDNLIIHGDNLKALKSLLPTYSGKVKCIYIDPPYNTGNENWAYNDNVNSPMIKEWLGKTVDKEDLTKHDKWLCMIMPRLKLLRELLSEDGAIFISCDDNEQHRLRALLDEIFGEENFIANIIWQKVFSPKNSAKFFSEDHDFICAYSKNNEKLKINLLERSEEAKDRYSNPDNDPRGVWTSGDLTARNFYGDGTYPIVSPSGRKIAGPPKGTYWRFSKKNFLELDKDHRIWWGENQDNIPRLKRFLSEVKEGVVPQTLWLHKDVGNTQEAKKEIVSILDFENSEDVFISPKPVRLISRILEISTDKDSIILDSFAGSGTTAHAVLAQNEKDGGSRKFIIIEMEDYASTLTAERVKRVIKGVSKSKDEGLKKGLGGSFSYFKLGEPIEMESILQGKKLPSYKEFARYLYYTATGEQFDEKEINEKNGFIGESKNYEVFAFYRPDLAWLKSNALTLDGLKALPKFKKKTRLVFAPAKYVDDHTLLEYRVEFCQLPYEIYRIHK